MFDFLKHNRLLALALAGTAVFLLCLVIWLAGMLGDDGTAPAPVAGAAQSGQTSQPAVTPANATTGQAAPSPGTEGRIVNGKQLPSWVPACAPQCPGPWDSKGFYDDIPDAAPDSGTGKP